MAISLANITLDCDDTGAVATFWSAVLGLPLDDAPPEVAPYFRQISTPDGSANWLFIKVPEPKTAKNRQHLDFTADDRAAEHERLLGLGASHVGDYTEHGFEWSTYRDPEGNEFCVG